MSNQPHLNSGTLKTLITTILITFQALPLILYVRSKATLDQVAEIIRLFISVIFLFEFSAITCYRNISNNLITTAW